MTTTKMKMKKTMPGNGNDDGKKDDKKVNTDINIDTEGGRPKSRKELRLEKKAAKKKASATTAEGAEAKASNKSPSTFVNKTDDSDSNNNNGDEIEKEEYLRLKKLKRIEVRKEQEILLRKEEREVRKIRKRKKLNREMNAKGGVVNNIKKKQKAAAANAAAADKSSDANNKSSSKKKQKVAAQNDNNEVKDERDVSMGAFRSVFHGSNNGAAGKGGMTTTLLGVQYVDKTVGKGKLMKEGVEVTVKYELTGGQFGAVLDSSKKFSFRPGMGEVIRGWDIGLDGMREGGRRKLIVPPKAGYGGKDIGAGPGALLYFDVILVSCGR